MTIHAPARPVRKIGDLATDFTPQPIGTRLHIEVKESPRRLDGCTRDADTCPNAYDECVECDWSPPAGANVSLTKLEAELSRNPLDEIASLMRSLTYGEMIELGEAIWKVKGEGEITQGTLPGILHRWSKS